MVPIASFPSFLLLRPMSLRSLAEDTGWAVFEETTPALFCFSSHAVPFGVNAVGDGDLTPVW